MKIIINSGGQNYGPYTINELVSLVGQGKFVSTDFSWNDKDRFWATVGDTLQIAPTLAPVARTSPPSRLLSTSGVIVSSRGQKLGPFSEADLQAHMISGKIDRNDLAWSEATKSWISIAELVGVPQPIEVKAPLPKVVQSKNIIISAGGQNYGPYTSDQVLEFVRWGIFQTNDFAWSEATNAWVSLAELLHATAIPEVKKPDMAPIIRQPSSLLQPLPPLQYGQPFQPPYPSQLTAQLQPPMQAQVPQLNQLPRAKKSTRRVDPSRAKVIVISSGKKYGPYTPGHAHEFLRCGKFNENDFAWSDAHNSWLTLGEVINELRPYARKDQAQTRSLTGPLPMVAPMPSPMAAPMPPSIGYSQAPMIPSVQMAPAMARLHDPISEVLNKPYIEKNPAPPRRRHSAASVMAATAKNFGPSF